MKKYILTETTKEWFGVTLYQIKAVRQFGNVEEGDLGGWVEKEENLSHAGDAWIYGNARVFGNARVYGDARISGNARVYGNALVYGNAEVSGNARVYGNAEVSDNARVSVDARVYGNALVYGNAEVSDNARVYGDARISGNARVYGDALVESMKHVVWFSSVGSENGTLTAYTTKTREIEVTRGCFKGTIDHFESAVKDTHSDNRYAKEYLALIQYIRLRFRDISVKEGSAIS